MNDLSEKFIQKIIDWVHEDSDNINQIQNRAMFVAGCPIFISLIIGLLFVVIIKIVGL